MDLSKKVKITYLPVEKLKLWDQNPRQNERTVPMVMTSIQEYGFLAPIVIGKDNVVKAGNTRLKAAIRLGMKEVPVVYADHLSEKQLVEFAIADNRLTEIAEWKDVELTNLIRDFDISSIPGFTDDQVKTLAHMVFDGNMPVKEGEEGDKDRMLPYTTSDIVEAAAEYFKAIGYPVPNMTVFEMMQEINELAMVDLETCPNSHKGHRVADVYNRHRILGEVTGAATWKKLFDNPKRLRALLSKDMKYYGKIDPLLGSSWTRIYGGTQMCSNFRPAFARYIYDSFCPKGGKVFDPSTGYGGRLVGFLASHCSEYVGTDPNTLTCKANTQMAKDLAGRKKVRIYDKPIEDFEVKPYRNHFDLSFTSPPYFVKEIYSNESTQSSSRYPAYEAWLDGFLKPFMTQNFALLKPGGLLMVNIEDVNLKKTRYKLVDPSVELGKAAGFDFEGFKTFPLTVRPKKHEDGYYMVQSEERVILFRKPS